MGVGAMAATSHMGVGRTATRACAGVRDTTPSSHVGVGTGRRGPAQAWGRGGELLCVHGGGGSEGSTSVRGRDENGRKTPQPFSTFTFEYENKTESSKVGHENEHELTKILVF